MNPLETQSPLATSMSDLTDRANAISEHLDSFVNNITILATSSVTVGYDAGSFSYPDTVVDVGSGISNAFLAFVQRSDQPSRFYQIPYYEVLSAALTLHAYAWTFQGKVHVGGQTSNPYPTAAPASLTFYYYLLQQPANPVLT